MFHNVIRMFFFYFLFILIGMFNAAFAAEEIELLSSKFANEKNVPKAKIDSILKSRVDIAGYRAIKIQIIFNAKYEPDHLLVYLHSREHHQVIVSRINIDSDYNATSGLVKDYRLTEEDIDQQPGISASRAYCPDSAVEFIAFAPNNIPIEQRVTIDVAKDAENHHLKTIQLLKEEATRTNYLNYMSCPNLKGNFYDGDANTEEIVTVDGIITYRDINRALHNAFRYKVTNIWLACQAYNNPIKDSVIVRAQAQKYAAGINNLLIGPSDEAAACAMKAALAGKPMTASFDKCYKEYDVSEDHWGFGGQGTDFFGT